MADLEGLRALRDRLAGPDGLAEVERMLSDPPPQPIERDFPIPAGTIRGVLLRRWAPGNVPGSRVPLIHRGLLEVDISDGTDGGFEHLTPAEARQTAAALIAAAAWAEGPR